MNHQLTKEEIEFIIIVGMVVMGVLSLTVVGLIVFLNYKKRKMFKANKVQLVPMPATKIMMTLAPMMAAARGWKVGLDIESRIRMANKYFQVAALLN